MVDMSKRVVVTGGASGLGLEIAKAFSGGGARVVLADVNQERGLAAAEGLKGEAHFVRCDVRDWAATAELAQETDRLLGGCDVLVNNAGIAEAGSLAASSPDDWSRLVEINLMGVVRCSKAFAPQMTAARKGHILNIASYAGIAQAPGMIAYNTVKGAVISFSESLRGEMAQSGVKVSVVCPSFFRTNLTESMSRASPETVSFVHKLMDSSSITAEDVARAVVEATKSGRFLVLPHKSTRSQHLLKRFLPEFYFQQVLKTAGRGAEKLLPR